MAKLNLEPEPTFVAKVEIPVAGEGRADVISITFKYRTRKELTAFVDTRHEHSDVESFLDMVTSWDIDNLPFTRENVERLLEVRIGAAGAVYNKYLEELTKARQGN
jgi:hypothetical protein